jgi:hypothetical protein
MAEHETLVLQDDEGRYYAVATETVRAGRLTDEQAGALREAIDPEVQGHGILGEAFGFGSTFAVVGGFSNPGIISGFQEVDPGRGNPGVLRGFNPQPEPPGRPGSIFQEPDMWD